MPPRVAVDAQERAAAVRAAFDPSDATAQRFGRQMQFCGGDPAACGAVDLVVAADPRCHDLITQSSTLLLGATVWACGASGVVFFDGSPNSLVSVRDGGRGVYLLSAEAAPEPEGLHAHLACASRGWCLRCVSLRRNWRTASSAACERLRYLLNPSASRFSVTSLFRGSMSSPSIRTDFWRGIFHAT